MENEPEKGGISKLEVPNRTNRLTARPWPPTTFSGQDFLNNYILQIKLHSIYRAN